MRSGKQKILVVFAATLDENRDGIGQALAVASASTMFAAEDSGHYSPQRESHRLAKCLE